MQQYKTIDDLIVKLEEFKESFGNIPILISSNGSDDDFLKPLMEAFTVKISEKETDDSQIAVVLANYEIIDADENNNPMEAGL